MISKKSPQENQFLGVYFVKCKIYSRLYKDKEGKFYVGFCPKCGCSFRVLIGDHGTNQRFFKAFCV